jgi:hypothetical protein
MGVKERPFCRFWIGPTVASSITRRNRMIMTNTKKPYQDLMVHVSGYFQGTSILPTLLPSFSKPREA